MTSGNILDFLSVIIISISFCLLVNGEIVVTPKQSGSWNDINYTLLSSVGYSHAVSPFKFEVKACSDAHIGLLEFDHPISHGRIYEIAIGGWLNSKSVLRSSRQQNPAEDTHAEKYLLHCLNFRTFQITWDSNGLVNVFKYDNGSMELFLSWTNPKPFPIKFIGVSTGLAKTGTWNITIPDYSTIVQTTTAVSTTTITTTTSAASTINTSTNNNSGTTSSNVINGNPSMKSDTNLTNNNSGIPSPTTNTTPSSHQAISSPTSSTNITSVAGNLTIIITTSQEQTATATLCPCMCSRVNISYTPEELKEEIQKLREELVVVKSTTSKYVRTKISAGDSRASSKVMGGVAGMVLAIMLGGIVILDIPNLIKMFQEVRR